MPNKSGSIERARPGDGEAVARLLSQIIPPGLNELSIWGSPLLARYLEETLSGRTPDIDRELFVLRIGSCVGGAASLRTTVGGDIWVDAIYVSPEARGGMRADLLAATAIRRVAEAMSEADWVSWDAFIGNQRHDRWHDRMGAIEQERKGWWISPRDYGCESAKPGMVYGLAEADHQHSAWRFSMLDVETSVGRYRVGRLPGPYFRLVLPEVPRDPELFAALRGIDRNRRVFLVGPESMPHSDWERVAATRRLRSRYRDILGYLDAMIRLSDRGRNLAALSAETRYAEVTCGSHPSS